MTPHREWFSEYEKYDGGDVFLGDDSTKKILGCGRVKLLLKYGRIRTLLGVIAHSKTCQEPNICKQVG
jgi:hypothetical protein